MMSIRSKMLFTTLAIAAIVPATSFAYWVPNNTEQGGVEIYDWSNMKSRAQVLQELEEAKADPTWATRQGEATGSWPQDKAAPGKTRAQVLEELAQAKADPTWATRRGEATGLWPQDKTAPGKTRAQVREELESMTAAEKAYIESFDNTGA